jgi:hypothetical protein
MRERVDRTRLHAFMRALAEETRRPLQVYLVGGATAVLEGWRDSTIDVERGGKTEVRLSPRKER